MSALIFVFYEAAKFDYKSFELSSVIEEFIVKSDRVKYICEKFEGQKQNIRSVLDQKSFQYPALLDIDWRLDYIMKTNELQKTNENLYSLNMKMSDGSMKIFTCTLAELQELHEKLTGATKQVERYLNQ